MSREVLQVSDTKVHVAGSWQRFTANGTPQVSSAITYIVTKEGEHWGIQARFAAEPARLTPQTVARNGGCRARRRGRVSESVEQSRCGGGCRSDSSPACAHRR